MARLNNRVILRTLGRRPIERVGLEGVFPDSNSIPKDKRGICASYDVCRESKSCDGYGNLGGKRNKFRQRCHSYTATRKQQ